MLEENETQEPRGFSRRTLVKGAAWSVPVIAAAVATPLAAATGATDVGDFQLNGDCGLLGLAGAGFELTAGAQPLPAGTQITLTGSGLAGISVIDITGGLANVSILGSSATITLTAPLPAGQTMTMTSLISLSLAWTVNAALTLPAGYTAGAGAKSAGSVSSTLIICSDS